MLPLWHCGEKFGPGYRCKPETFAHLVSVHEENDVQSVDGNQNENIPPTN